MRDSFSILFFTARRLSKPSRARCRLRSRDFAKEDGSIMIETALGFMIMFLMVLGIIECCMMGYTYAVLEDAAREGVRYASLHGVDSANCSGPSSGCADATGAHVADDVKNYAGGFAGNLTGMAVTVTYPDASSAANSRVLVAIVYTYQPIFHSPGASQVLRVSSQGRILY